MPVRSSAAIAIAASLCWLQPSARGDTVKLSLAEALARAEAQSPLVRRARAERLVVAAQRVGAAVILPFNPAVSATVGHRSDASTSDPKSHGLEWSLRVEQPVEIAGQRGTRMKEANRAIDVALARERFALVETRARVRGAYIAMRLSENHLGFARKREELGRRVYESARARVTAGAASDVELHIAEVEAGRLASDRILAELALSDAANDLRLMLHVPIDAALELTTPLERPGPIGEALAALLDHARARRADLAALEKTHSQLDAALIRLRREVVPSPTLFFDAAQQQPGQTYFGGGIGIPIPLWQRNQGALAITRAEMARNEEEHGLLERQVVVEVANLYRAVFARTQEADLWERDVVHAAEANVDLINQGWRAGKFDLFRVVQASREAGEARRKQLEVMGALWHASIELDRATGTP